MSLWEARLSTEHVGRYMDCCVGSSNLEWCVVKQACQAVGPTDVVQQVHEVTHGGLPIHSVHVTPPITAARVGLGTPGRESVWINVSKTSTLLC